MVKILQLKNATIDHLNKSNQKIFDNINSTMFEQIKTIIEKTAMPVLIILGKSLNKLGGGNEPAGFGFEKQLILIETMVSSSPGAKNDTVEHQFNFLTLDDNYQIITNENQYLKIV